MRCSVSVLCCLIALACDPAPQPTPSTAPAPSGRERVEARVVAQLPTSRPTHLARTGDGTIWWVQEGDEHQAVAFSLGPDGVPRATPLTTPAVLDALRMGGRGGTRAGGTIHSLAAGGDGRVWFYFAASAGQRAASCVGAFNPRDGSIAIVLDDAALRKATGMNASLVLARGTLVARGDDALWVWVRHSDGAALLRLDVRTGAVSRPFDAVKTAAGETLALTSPSLAMGSGPGGLLLLDPDRVELWRIDDAGRATSLHALVGLPTVLSAPAGDAAGRAFVLAADAPLIPARSDEEARQILSVRNPALIVIDAGKLRAIGRDDFRAPEGFAVEDMRVQQLIAEPDAGSLLGYDEKSGALLRFRMITGR